MTNLYIEAGAIAEERTSGIGNATLNIIRTLADDKEFSADFRIQLLVPFNKTHLLKRYNLPVNLRVRKIYIPGKIMGALSKYDLFPSMDIFFGKGVYLFPNFKNWPLARSRSITYIHDVAFLRYPEFIEDKNLRFLRRNVESWLRRTDAIVTVSKHAASEIREFYPNYAEKVRTVYNGIDTAYFRPQSQEEQDRVCEKYELHKNSYFMFLSNLEPRKNVDGLLEGFRQYCDAYDMKRSRQLLLVGGMGWSNDSVVEKIESLRSQGYQIVRPDHFVPDEDLPGLLSASAGLIHPAFYEGFGLSPLQAMACGKNVAVGNNSSLPEVVGNAGSYIEIASTEGVCEGYVALDARKDSVNEDGLARAREFTWSKTLLPLKVLVSELTDKI